ncbi:hypothetical protein AD948_03520 [Acetobacter senegalensis]|uniref:Alpha/beta hydrolase n=1 Tax=Acetobacter senegalensis TaxID=446692 RepID=A0A149U684_9PROT|nr:alpha/beta hydrolase [Acetobacter senegalensis]KXV60922.1 hypothetical protein AD948_03520 [Acetobacter senegalensis]
MIRRLRLSSRTAAYGATLFLLAGCTSPISVHEMSLQRAYMDRSRSALNGDLLSNTTHTVLQRQNLLKLWETQPTRTIATLRAMTQRHFYAHKLEDQLFALAELSYQRARKTHDRAQFMAAALYAYAYLNPSAPEADRPSGYDPHFRQACDIYMFALTEALGAPITLSAQRWTLSYGTLDVEASATPFQWHGHSLTDLRPLARLSIKGLQNIYRHVGLGEPVAGLPHLTQQESRSFQITDKLRVPLNLQLVMTNPRQQVLADVQRASLHLAAIDDPEPSPPQEESTPLQYDQTAARGLSLNEAMDWSTEYKGFLDGRLFDQGSIPQLITIEPHQHGHRPVILVHGTASSAARWADMINDLLEDTEIRQNYEFWLFSYATGNPIPYSALQLREALQQAVSQLGGVQADPALGEMTLIGHSQGGLLIKLLAIDAGDKLWDGMISRPLDSLNLSANSKTLLQEALFPKPLPEVKSVVFISTPQHGSYIAGFSLAHLVGRMVTFPITVTEVTKAVMESDPNIRRLNMRPWRVGSVYGMSPHSSFIRSLATIPVANQITAHSIIPVLGDGPLDKQNDGVVSYKSAHAPDVDSELVVRRSGHSTQSNPITIAEVRRILLAQLHNGSRPPQTAELITRNDIMTLGGEYVPTTRTHMAAPQNDNQPTTTTSPARTGKSVRPTP